MVGFGSSLRRARRSGWEGGYLDYETLKLLLSQIEAVYEEDSHRRRYSDDQLKQRKRQYQTDLFLESDSDKAFGSVAHLIEDNESLRLSQEEKGFTLTYSHETTSSDDDPMESGCGVQVSEKFTSWTRWGESNNSSEKPSPTKNNKKIVRKKPREPEMMEDDDVYYVPNTVPHGSFFLEVPSAQDRADSAFAPPPTETTSLLPPTTPVPKGSSFYSFGPDTLTPPSGRFERPTFLAPPTSTNAATASAVVGPPILPNLNPNLQQERQDERKLRRLNRRKLRRQRQAHERKVPRYIRIAHSKARAITERFLGLLRAETEKVLLFAQSRLGELADTAGSLRFPSFDDDYHYGSSSMHSRPTTTTNARSYSYPLSDGGLHPSASSSDDENVGQRTFPWSDSSGDESRASQRRGSAVQASYSGGALSDDTRSRPRSVRRGTPQGVARKITSSGAIKASVSASTVLHAARRQIAHFAEIRNSRPVFQRYDHILGEDLLFLSAIEEADGFTAVGVELMHVLRFICVNLIAVRKICRKHDRLLMNRMLGGYYHRARSREPRHGGNEHVGDARTLGGLVAQASGDIYEAHPALIGQMNHYKLVGVYDKKIQKLANSRTVQVISSCLALALSEYEVARSRADALTKLNSSVSARATKRAGGIADISQPLLESDDEVSDGPPSTASVISLTRLRFTVTSIFALREAARYKMNEVGAYLSRSVMTFTGLPVVGEGLDGCSRETLDFFIAYNPDAALLLDSSLLFQGLQHGHWLQRPIGEVMASALATCTIPENLAPNAALSLLSHEQKVVAGAVCILPESKNSFGKTSLKGGFPIPLSRSLDLGGFPDGFLVLNCRASFLYMVNYFVAHAPTGIFVTSTGSAPAYSAIIIGAPNWGALLAAMLHCWWLTGTDRATPTESAYRIRRLLIMSALLGVVGNILHGTAVMHKSVHLAVLGRFIVGFTASDVLTRQIIAFCRPATVVTESARLARYKMAGIAAGLLLGSAAEAIPVTINSIDVREVQVTGWVMMAFWFVHFVQLCVKVRPEGGLAHSDEGAKGSLDGSIDQKGVDARAGAECESDSSDAEVIGSPTSLLYRSSSDITSDNLQNYGSKGNSGLESMGTLSNIRDSPPVSSSVTLSRKKRFGPCRQLKTFASRISKLMAFHVGIPISLALLAYSSFGLEVFLTATPIITRRYFGWSGVYAGLLLAALAIFILPIHFVCEWISRRYEARTVVKRSLQIVAGGLLLMMNWLSLFTLATRVPMLLTDTEDADNDPQQYDWKFGLPQYVCGLIVTFVGLTALDGANLSMLSKVSPQRLRSAVINIGTITTVLTLAARLAADLQILMVDLSQKLINTDIVNSLVIPLVLACLVLVFVVKQHYFFLL